MIDLLKTAVSLLALAFAFVAYAQETDSRESPEEQVVPVADESPEPAESTDQELSDEERILLEFERYKQYINEGSMDEADVSAKRVVEMAIRLYGPQSIETSKALNNLALVQHKTGQYGAAIQNFESAIEIVEIREDRLHQLLVNPLKGLGASQLANGRPDLATQAFNRATHITHVNDGPHNIEQVEILESLAESTLRMGDMDGARDLLDRIHALNVRHFDNNELALLPSLMRRADWQHRAGYFNDERATYRRAIRIVEAKRGKDDPELIVPLRKLGESFYYVDINQAASAQHQGIVATGEIYFKRAVRIAEKSEELSWQELADTKLALADYYVYVDAHNRARKIYREMWDFLSTDEERLSLRREVLEQPMVLIEETLPRYAGSAPGLPAEEYNTGTIRVDFTVSKRGRVRNIRTEAIPPQFTDMQRIVHREVRNRVFRPMIADAQPVESDDLLFEHTFFYRQTDLEKLRDQETRRAEPEDTSRT